MIGWNYSGNPPTSSAPCASGRMDIKKLNYFIHVAELGSLTRASISLGIEQSTLSRHIRALEEELNVPLFHRDGRGVNITDAGEKLLVRSRRIMAELSMLTHDLALLTEEPSGRLRIGLVPSIGELVTDRLLRRFEIQFPRMTLEIVEGFNGALNEWLAAGRLDIAVLYAMPATRSLVVEPLLTEPLVFVADMGRAATMPDVVELGDLRSVPLALPSANNGLRMLVEAAARKAGVELDIRYEVNSIALIRGLVRSGTVCSILPATAARADAAAGLVVVRQLGNPRLSRSMVLVDATQVPSSHPLRRLNRLIKDVIRESLPEIQGSALPDGTN